MAEHKKLKELAATAICGNDITSSCLYVSALTTLYAGQYAWLALLIVASILYLYRKIYGEVVGALPLNGGAYNVLLNTTSKSNATIAACLTILSYMATAVLSAGEAIHYLQSLINSIPHIPSTLALLTFFLILVSVGISESSVLATTIFIIHISAMLILIGSACVFVFYNGTDLLMMNFNNPMPTTFGVAVFLGVCTAMLGVSGFESSANFIEEQAPGVFKKTLRNMWIAVTVINPLMAFSIIMVLPIAEVGPHKEALLSYLGNRTGGPAFATFISIDAVLVLSGAVLTSFVGVSGLIRRMTLDRILPQFLLKENSRGSSYRILIVFYLLCASVLFITQGKLGPLAGVYTISFLLVMVYFAWGNFLLKIKRSRLPRPEYATPLAVTIAAIAVIAALYGNIRLHPEYLVIFIQYFVPAVVLMIVLLNRNKILQYLMVVMESVFDLLKRMSISGRMYLRRYLNKLTQQQFVYFTKADDISVLNKVIIYVIENEITNKLKIVNVYKEDIGVNEKFLSDIDVLDRAYPELEIDFIRIPGSFGPELIQKLSKEWNIPTNFMFISSPGDKFAHKVSDLGGVRLII